jgi:hypothetical protein
MDLGMLTLTLAFSTFATGVATDHTNPHFVAFALGAIFVAFGIFWATGVWLSQRRAPAQWQDGSISAAQPLENSETVLVGTD